jgi:hypothetical protein
VEARHRGELVDQRRRLQDAIGVRLLGDGVDHAEVEQPRRRHRKRREDDDPGQARDQHGVAIDHVPVRRADDQPGQHRDDHRPVAPDVDPVRQPGETVVVDEVLLHRRFDVDAEAPLEIDDPAGVAGRRRGRSLGEGPHGEVDDDRADEDAGLGQPEAAAGSADVGSSRRLIPTSHQGHRRLPIHPLLQRSCPKMGATWG